MFLCYNINIKYMKGEAMLKRKFTVVSQLHETNNMDIIHYFEEPLLPELKKIDKQLMKVD